MKHYYSIDLSHLLYYSIDLSHLLSEIQNSLGSLNPGTDSSREPFEAPMSSQNFLCSLEEAHQQLEHQTLEEGRQEDGFRGAY